MKKVVFELNESPYQPGKYMIRVKNEDFYTNQTEGSFNILPARLMNLSYAQYLRMCRDIFDADIYGKDSLYPIPYFTDRLKASVLMNNLNARANLVLFDRENPDFKKQEEVVRKYNAAREQVKEECNELFQKSH